MTEKTYIFRETLAVSVVIAFAVIILMMGITNMLLPNTTDMTLEWAQFFATFGFAQAILGVFIGFLVFLYHHDKISPPTR
jgi:hypothetical protein